MYKKNGASEGIRTLDNHLGKVTLYQAELRSPPEVLQTLRTSLKNASLYFTLFWGRIFPGYSPSKHLFKIINQGPVAVGLEDLLHKFEMLRVNLVIVLGLFVLKDQVQSHLVGLVHHRTMAGTHPAHMKMQNAWNVR